MVRRVKTAPQHGEVIAVAKGVRLESAGATAAEVKIGDHILFGEYSGAEIRLSGETYLMMQQDEIIEILPATADVEEEISR